MYVNVCLYYWVAISNFCGDVDNSANRCHGDVVFCTFAYSYISNIIYRNVFHTDVPKHFYQSPRPDTFIRKPYSSTK